MSINPPIISTLNQLLSPSEVFLRRVSGTQEIFIAHRGGVEGEFKHPELGKFTAQGKLWLTSERIIFTCPPPYKTVRGINFEGFDIPLRNVSSADFCQPILGANYLGGAVQLTGVGGGASYTVQFAPWRVYFKSGGFGTFVGVFFQALERSRIESEVTPATHYQSAWPAGDDEYSSGELPQAVAQWVHTVEGVPIDRSDTTQVISANAYANAYRIPQASAPPPVDL